MFDVRLNLDIYEFILHVFVVVIDTADINERFFVNTVEFIPWPH